MIPVCVCVGRRENKIFIGGADKSRLGAWDVTRSHQINGQVFCWAGGSG